MFEKLPPADSAFLRLGVFDVLMYLAPDVALHRAYFVPSQSPQERMVSYLFLFCMAEQPRLRIAILLYDQDCFSGVFPISRYSASIQMQRIWDYV
jgi:hypothetical protein